MTARTNARVKLSSCGLRYQPPPVSNVTYDVRGLKNPDRVAALRPLTGLNDEVATYVLDQELAQETLDVLIAGIVLQLQCTTRLPAGELRVTLYCTSGKHLSVAMVEELAAQLRLARPDVVVVTEHLNIRSDQEDPRREIEPDQMWQPR